jgi:hypothetical protein
MEEFKKWRLNFTNQKDENIGVVCKQSKQSAKQKRLKASPLFHKDFID